MPPLRRLAFACLLPLLARPAPALPPLFDNGRAFCLADRRLRLACLDEPGLLGMDGAARARLLDEAVAEGFNAVSFEAPMFGAHGLSPKLGDFGGVEATALERALHDCARRRLYAFPVLYPPSGVEGLIRTPTARADFFSGRRAWGWQCWALERLAGLDFDGRPLTRAGVVGGWLLYRGPWPGGQPLARAASPAPRADVPGARLLAAWTAATVRAARRLGFRQELGADLWLQGDLGADAGAAPESPDAPPPGASADLPPLSPLQGGDAPSSATAGADLDALPPVPGSQALGLDDSALLPPAPGYAGPDALDWGAVRTFLDAFPRVTQLDFLECTLDSEDWFGAGALLASAARSSEVPVLWRQDWRQAPRYERARHRTAPAPLAGLDGPWPDDDWRTGFWRRNPEDPAQAPFYVRRLELERVAGSVRLGVDLGLPAAVDVSWGARLPLRGHAALRAGPGPAREASLGRLAPGSWFLIRILARSPRYGVCLVRTQWVRAP